MQNLRNLIHQYNLRLKVRLWHFRRKRTSQDISKLNLGCGFDLREGYINVDRNSRYKPDILGDILPVLKTFEDDSIEEVLAIHVINYLSHEHLIQFIKQSLRILKKGGRLIVEGPDLSKTLSNVALSDFNPKSLYPLFATDFKGPTHEQPYINAIPYNWLWKIALEIDFQEAIIENPITHGSQINRDSRLVAIK